MLTGRCGTCGSTGGAPSRPPAGLYAPGTQFSFTYPPFAAALFRLGTTGREGWLAAGITVLSIGALVVLVWLSLTAAGMRPRPETVFALAALSALLWPVAYTLHLGEINLIVAAVAVADLLRRRDGGWWQGIGTGLAAGIKLTPLIFVVYLLITRRLRRRSLRPWRSRPRSRPGGCCCPLRRGCSGWMGCSRRKAGVGNRPTRRTSHSPGQWPGWPGDA